jgi:hypothetical protein
MNYVAYINGPMLKAETVLWENCKIWKFVSIAHFKNLLTLH